MQINSKFAVAIHVLALAKVAASAGRGEAITSEQMAESVNTNPVVVRRILGSLREAGLVSSQPGPGGGWRLTRPADQITLQDVYRGLVDAPIFTLPRSEPNAACPVGSRLPHILETCFREAEAAMEERLASVTIADVIDAVIREGWCAHSTTVPQLHSAGA
jgi:Rrf2 family protein